MSGLTTFGAILFLTLAGFVAGEAPGVEVIDRMAVIVGRHVIKTSDILRDLRVTEFLNREPLELGAEARRKSAERLIDQEIIRQEILTGGYRRPSDEDGEAFEKQLEKDRFHGSTAEMRAALSKYGLTQQQLREQLLWQLTVLRFIDQRFRAGVLVTDDDVKNYYDQHQEELRRQNPQANSLEGLQPKIRSSLEGERINEIFNQWLEHERKISRIEYKQEAFE
jgi:peptidyl-prolyl cis-trans isomerase SurA